ncbi:MAG: SAM-dependent methyltransferase [Rhodothalassiaceae bacterium]|nr:MAG: SAM-dependent methyltransferase [Rhodothalassiaceae bacterium]
MTKQTPMTSQAARHAPATLRNREPILAILRAVLPAAGTVLEVASGTGEHAVFFAPRLAPRRWLPSDPDPANRASIAAWAEAVPEARPHLVLPPRALDVTAARWPVEDEALGPPITAIVAINLIHIAPIAALYGLMAGAGRILPEGGVLYLYGAMKIGGRHTAASNEAFDRWLKEQDPRWGVRDLAEVEAAARPHGLRLVETIPMPANNFSVILTKGESGAP